MAETCIYVFEKSDDRSPGFVGRAARELEKRGVIASFEEPLENFDAVSARETSAVRFESLGVRITKFAGLIPEEPAVAPACRSCRTRLDEDWYELVNDAYESSADQDWTKVQLSCPKCRKRSSVLEVDDLDGGGVFARKEFIFFSDVTGMTDPGAITAWIREMLGDVEIAIYTST